MKCPNCASDVPNNSNFCGVCGSDIRAQRANSPNETLVIDSEARAQALTAHLSDQQDDVQDPSPMDTSMSATMVDAPPPAEPLMSEPPQDTGDLDSENQPNAVSVDEPEAEQPELHVDQNDASTANTVNAADEVVIQTSAKMPVLEPKTTPVVSGSGSAPQEGGFRETLWFMQAQNPDSIEAIDNVDVRHLADSYEDKGGAMETAVREQFSLNVSDEPLPTPQQQTFDTEAFRSLEVPGVENKKKYTVAALIVAVIAAVGWYFFGG